MVKLTDVIRKAIAQKPADQRHTALKHTEEQGNDACMILPQLRHGQSAADCHGKGIHGKTHGNEKQFDKAHLFPPSQNESYYMTAIRAGQGKKAFF